MVPSAYKYVIGVIKQIPHGFCRSNMSNYFPRGDRTVASTSGKIVRPITPLTMWYLYIDHNVDFPIPALQTITLIPKVGNINH